MKTHYRLLSIKSFFTFFLFLFFSSGKTRAQISVSFNTSDTITCTSSQEEPNILNYPVYFLNTTPGSISGFWNFGDPASGTSDTTSNGGPWPWSAYHEYTTAGTYTVTLTAHTGSGSGSKTQVIHVNPSPHATYTSTQVSGSTYLFTSTTAGTVTSYSWEFGGGGSSTVNPATHTFTGSNTMSLLIVQNNFGCVDTAYATSWPTGITVLTQDNSVHLYPNPSSNGIYTLQLESDHYQTASYEIVNALGQLIRKREGLENTMVIDLSSEAAGVYYLSLYRGNTLFHQKLMLVR